MDWIAVKNTWELTATEPEAEALGEMLGTCAPSQTLTVVQASPIETAEPTPTAIGGAPPPSPNSGVDVCLRRRRRDGGRASCSRQQRTGARLPRGQGAKRTRWRR